MNTHRLTSADFDAPTQPAIHDLADTQWPAFTEPMAFDAQPAERSSYRAADFALAVVAASVAALWIAGAI